MKTLTELCFILFSSSWMKLEFLFSVRKRTHLFKTAMAIYFPIFTNFGFKASAIIILAGTIALVAEVITVSIIY